MKSPPISIVRFLFNLSVIFNVVLAASNKTIDDDKKSGSIANPTTTTPSSAITLSASFSTSTIVTPLITRLTTGEKLLAQDSEECQKILAMNGPMVRPILLVGGDKFPLTIPEVDAHCELGKRLYKGFNAYKKCVKGLLRQSLIILNHGIRKFMRSICNSKQKKEDTIIELKCAMKDTLPGWTHCLESVNRQLDWAARNSTDKNLLSNLCCVYTEATECVRTRTGTVPGCNSKADTSKFLLSSMDAVLKEALDFVCGRYQHREDCVANNPEGVKILREIAEKNEGNVEDPFLINPILMAVNRLAGDDDTDQ
ncbi:uncharacterized protein LOC141854405 [Brevipalpus obovatus]|uniref:uncharacterized protein LOC141854405 n=1 Tax=Brevipalpus obovatus TaxID=246614 RepID=UPI003D9DF6C5